jgi:hypothetical protein
MSIRNTPDFPVNGEKRDVLIHGREVSMNEIPLSVQRDWIIRAKTEQVLHFDDETVTGVTKEIREQQQTPLDEAKATVVWPYAHQDKETADKNNTTVKKFAFDAYDALAKHFAGATEWEGWFIAPRFPEGDDTRAICQLGVFVTDNFTQTVVE